MKKILKQKKYYRLAITLKTIGLISIFLLSTVILISPLLNLDAPNIKIELLGQVQRFNTILSWLLILLPYLFIAILSLAAGEFYDNKYKQVKKNSRSTKGELSINAQLLQIMQWFSFTVAFIIPILILEYTKSSCEKTLAGGCSIETAFTSHIYASLTLLVFVTIGITLFLIRNYRKK